MDEVTNTKVYEYQSEVTVEIMGADSGGEFTIVSYNFDLDDDGTTIQRRGDIESSHRPTVDTALEEAGYSFE